MTKTEAAQILARHILTEAVERGVPNVTDSFVRDVVAEAQQLTGTRWDLVAQAAHTGPALACVKHHARLIIRNARTGATA